MINGSQAHRLPLPQDCPAAAPELPGDPTVRVPAGVPVAQRVIVLSGPDFPELPQGVATSGRSPNFVNAPSNCR